MREIKFRAWNTMTKRWYKVTQPNLRRSSIVPAEDEIICEYTGLKDKNDVEIYEGDVLRHQHHKKAVAVMEWCIDGWKVRVNTPKGPHWHEFYEGRGDDYGTGKNGWYEVIGNIYENPELLEKVNKEG